MKVDFSGFDRLTERLERFRDPQAVQVSVLFNADFLSRCSSFMSITEMLDGSPVKFESVQDFWDGDDKAWDDYIREKTSYSSWKDMRAVATHEWMKRRFNE